MRQWTRAERVRATIAYWLLVVGCFVIAAGGWYLVTLQSEPARTARPVSAKIEHVEVVSIKNPHGDSVSRPLIIYSYSAAGVRYTTDRLTSLGRQHSSSWAKAMAGRYHVGDTVTAYVAPLNPGSAFLVRDYDWRSYGFLVIPLVIGAGLALYWPWAGIRALAES